MGVNIIDSEEELEVLPAKSTGISTPESDTASEIDEAHLAKNNTKSKKEMEVLNEKVGVDNKAFEGEKSCCSTDKTVDTIEETNKEEVPEREEWSNHCDFFLACLGYAVGLVPYLTMLFMVGLPLFFLELSFGQYASIGPAKIYKKLLPASSGLGWGTVMIALLVSYYYNMIVAWTVYYIYAGFASELPWSKCHDDTSAGKLFFFMIFYNHTCVNLTTICQQFDFVDLQKALNRVSASEEYFSYNMLGLKDDSSWENMGDIQIHLVISLIIAWIIVALSLSKGVKSSGKVVYFTAIYPFVILVALLIRGVTLPGAYDGILWYLTPEWDKLMTVEPWADAATQIFYSLGVCFGTLVTFSSYNKFDNNCLRDAFIVSIGNCSTSIFSGFVIFSIVGFMAQELRLPVGEVIRSGPGLTFIVYPEALSKLPLSPLWSFLFFTMILTLGLDSQFAMVEAVTSAVFDQFPNTRRYTTTTVFSICLAFCVTGIPMCMNGGMFVFELFNWYSASWSILALAVLEFLVIAWFLGLDKYFANIREMKVNVGFTKYYFQITWKIVSPLLMIVLCVLTIWQMAPCSYKDYVFPNYIQILGLAISGLPMVPVVLMFAYYVCTLGFQQAFSTKNWKKA